MAKQLAKKSSKPQKIVKRIQPVARASKATKSEVSQEDQNLVMPTGEYMEGVGRRKTATARVRIYESTANDFIVNRTLVGNYFKTVPYAARYFNRPFQATGTMGKFAVTAMVTGSGIMGQLDAIIHGLARALVKFDPSFKPLLKTDGLLSRDSRMKETRKPGRGGKARRKRQSPKR